MKVVEPSIFICAASQSFFLNIKSTFGIDERDEEDVEVGEKRKNTEGGCSQHF